MPTNKEVMQMIEEEHYTVLEEVKTYIQDAMDEDGSEVEIRKGISNILGKAEEVESALRSAENDVRKEDSEEMEGESDYKNALDKASEIHQSDIKPTEDGLIELENHIKELKTYVNDAFDEENTILYDLIKDEEDEVISNVVQMESMMSDVMAMNEDDGSYLDSQRLSAQRTVDDFEGSITYNKEYSRIAPTYLDPLKMSLRELSDELSSNDSDSDELYSSMANVETKINNALAWFDEWS